MQFTAKVLSVPPPQRGVGKSGEWKRQEIIVETEDKYPKKVCVSLWGDKYDTALLQPGVRLAISFDIESREYNGRWYTDVKAWKVEPAESAGAAPGGGYGGGRGGAAAGSSYDGGYGDGDYSDSPF